MDRKVILSVDVGGSKYVVGLVRENGQIICKRRYNWRHISADSVVEQITEAMQQAIRENPGVQISAVGMTIPGLVDPAGIAAVEQRLSKICGERKENELYI